jgi:prepilin-type processing-associated H-X9-DG protein
LGLAAQNFVSATQRFPAGAVAKPHPNEPFAPWTLYRWSALAQLSPYLEQSALSQALDLEAPLYRSNLSLNPVNADEVALVVGEFLCPSDDGRSVNPSFGPTNYALCTGSGAVGGSPLAGEADGIGGINTRIGFDDITDGSSKTAIFSEGPLGVRQDGSHDPRLEYRFMFGHLLTETACNSALLWNYEDPRGFAWASGEYRTTLYNHYWPPNSPEFDCIGVRMGGTPNVRFTPYGWRAARSLHSGGVNVAYADGSVRFVTDDVSRAAWQAQATRAGGETVSE